MTNENDNNIVDFPSNERFAQEIRLELIRLLLGETWKKEDLIKHVEQLYQYITTGKLPTEYISEQIDKE